MHGLRFRHVARINNMAVGTSLPPLSTAFVVIAKKAYKPLYDENDELPISNLGALRLGFEALIKEDGSDFERASALWKEARELLIAEEENETSASALGKVQVEDDFAMEEMVDVL